MNTDIEFINLEKDLTDQDIVNFQLMLNISLPKDFVNHYKKFNGGTPNADRSEGLEFDYPFQSFYSIKYGENTIEKKTIELNDNNVEKLVFGENDLGNTFHICTTNNDYGKIFVYEEGRYEFHCENFAEFLKGLKKSKFYKKKFDLKQQKWIDEL